MFLPVKLKKTYGRIHTRQFSLIHAYKCLIYLRTFQIIPNCGKNGMNHKGGRGSMVVVPLKLNFSFERESSLKIKLMLKLMCFLISVFFFIMSRIPTVEGNLTLFLPFCRDLNCFYFVKYLKVISKPHILCVVLEP